MTSAPETLTPGTLFAGKYVVEQTLGQGGMGVVLAARHAHLQERVAIKCLLPQFAENREAVARFVQEARAARKIHSEHVVRIDDVDVLPSGTPYIVMECLEGQDLEGLVASTGALSVGAAVDFVIQALEALAEAHALGIVHRDLKPANLFLTHRTDGTPCIKVLDFGISKIASAARSTESSMTKTSAMLGSPHYMSPEQIRSARDVDARSDIWSMGVILQELVTGQLPFDSETIPDLFVRILTEAPRSVTLTRPDVPAAIELIVQRCLEKDAARRFQNVAELASALAEHGSPATRTSAERIGRVLQAFVATSLAMPAVTIPPSAAPPTQQDLAHARTVASVAPASLGGTTGFDASRTGPDLARDATKSRKSLVVGGVALAAVLGLVGFVAYSAGSRHGEAASSPTPHGTVALATVAPVAPSSADDSPVPPLAPVIPSKTAGTAASAKPHPSAAHATAATPSSTSQYAAAANAPLPPAPRADRRDRDAEEEDHPSQFHQFMNGIGRNIRRHIHPATE
jgi:serine/threonine-protein kinase